jgi:hypothetical protein
MPLGDAARAAIAATTRRHAKSSTRAYVDDGAEKRVAAMNLQRMAETIVGPTIAELNARRTEVRSAGV